MNVLRRDLGADSVGEASKEAQVDLVQILVPVGPASSRPVALVSQAFVAPRKPVPQALVLGLPGFVAPKTASRVPREWGELRTLEFVALGFVAPKTAPQVAR